MRRSCGDDEDDGHGQRLAFAVDDVSILSILYGWKHRTTTRGTYTYLVFLNSREKARGRSSSADVRTRRLPIVQVFWHGFFASTSKNCASFDAVCCSEPADTNILPVGEIFGHPQDFYPRHADASRVDAFLGRCNSVATTPNASSS